MTGVSWGSWGAADVLWEAGATGRPLSGMQGLQYNSPQRGGSRMKYLVPMAAAPGQRQEQLADFATSAAGKNCHKESGVS